VTHHAGKDSKRFFRKSIALTRGKQEGWDLNLQSGAEKTTKDIQISALPPYEKGSGMVVLVRFSVKFAEKNKAT